MGAFFLSLSMLGCHSREWVALFALHTDFIRVYLPFVEIFALFHCSISIGRVDRRMLHIVFLRKLHSMMVLKLALYLR